MTVATFYSVSADGVIEADHTTDYSLARGGNGAVVADSVTHKPIGQSYYGAYYVDEGFLRFDTSSIGSNSTISSAVLDLYGYDDDSGTNFTLLCASYAWTSPLAIGDFRNTSALAALSPVAQFVIGGGGFSTSGYNSLSDTGAGLASVVNKTGNTNLILWSDRLESATTPTGGETVAIWFGDEGGSLRPKLTVTYSTAYSATSSDSIAISDSVAGTGGTVSTNIDPLGRMGYFGL
jgi:hypothetical protein